MSSLIQSASRSVLAESIESVFFSGIISRSSESKSISLKSLLSISSGRFPLLKYRHVILESLIPIFIPDSIVIHFPVCTIPNSFSENFILLLSGSIMTQVEVNPKKAPSTIIIIPYGDVYVAINPATIKRYPAVQPTGPNDLSRKFAVFIFSWNEEGLNYAGGSNLHLILKPNNKMYTGTWQGSNGHPEFKEKFEAISQIKNALKAILTIRVNITVMRKRRPRLKYFNIVIAQLCAYSFFMASNK